MKSLTKGVRSDRVALVLTILLLIGCSSEEQGVPNRMVELPPVEAAEESKEFTEFTELEPYRDVTSADFSAAFQSSIAITGQSIPDWKAFSNEVSEQSPVDLQTWACLVRAEYQARSARNMGLQYLALEAAGRAFDELQQALKIDPSCVTTFEYVAVRTVLAGLSQHSSMINSGLWKRINQYPLGTAERSVLTEQTIAEATTPPGQCVDLLELFEAPVRQSMKEYSKQTFRLSIPADYEETGAEPDSVLSYYDVIPTGFHTVMILCGRDVNFEYTNQMRSAPPAQVLTDVAEKRMKRIGDFILCAGETTVCEIPARFFHTRRISLDARLISCQIYLFIKKENLYVMSFHCDADQIKGYRDLFTTVRQSFGFLK